MRIGGLADVRRKLRPGVLSSSAPSLEAQVAARFASGEQGGDWSDVRPGTTWQDAGATIPGVVGQTVYRLDDKSGRGRHLLQATAGVRPILQQDSGGRYYLQFDGVDDGMQAAISGWSTGMFVAAAIRPDTNGSHVLFSNAGVGVRYWGVSQAGSSSSISDSVGAPVTFVDGVQLSAQTRGALNTALVSGAAHVEDSYPLDLSVHSAFVFAMYTNFPFPGRFYGAIATVYSDATTVALVRKHLGQKAGLSL